MSSPNIIIIYADDLGYGDLGCFGASDFRTPALDALCASGARLSQWYSNSPVCSPSRASLLTGRYPAHAGVEAILGGTRSTAGLPQQTTLASELKERGYKTAIFGKWHLGASDEFSPLHYGFDEFFGFRAGCVDYYSHIFYWGAHNPIHDLWEDDSEVWLNGDYLTTEIGSRVAEFIERNSEDPFFCYVPFNAPHYPMHAPAKYMEMFSHLDDERRVMAAMVAAMDDAVSDIVTALESAGLRENTLIFVSSDNGPSAEDRNWLNGEEVSYQGGSTGGRRGTKGSVFEGGIGVPAIVSWPARISPGTTYDDLGMMMDVLPTVLEAVDGEDTPRPDIDGVSVLPALMDRPTGERSEDRSVFWAYEGQWAVRRGHLKLVVDAREGMTPPVVVDEALYNIELDRAETTDISEGHPSHEDLQLELARFRTLHAGWVASVPRISDGPAPAQ